MQPLSRFHTDEVQEAVHMLQTIYQTDFLKMQEMMINSEQAPCSVHHFHGAGVHIRQMYAPRGTLIVSRKHKFEHMNMMLKGKLLFLCEDGEIQMIEAPFFLVAPPGRKIVYVLEDMIWQNMMPTDLEDPEEVEKYFLEEEEMTLNTSNSASVLALENNHDFEVLKSYLASVSVRPELKMNIPNLRKSKSSIHGDGLFLTFPVKEGDKICQVKYGTEWLPPMRLLNHALNPNCMIVEEDGHEWLVALEDLEGSLGGQAGTELTVNYRHRGDIWMV